MSVRRATRQSAISRTVTTESVTSSVTTSAEGSPTMTPVKRSPSATSMSSLDSDSAHNAIKNSTDSKMIDTYGNQFEIPDFTIKQIRDAIPAHCYQRSAVRGFAYIARDILYLSVVFAFYYHCVTPEYVPSTLLRGALWAVYTIVQGMTATGIWVIAHECGHQSFSPSKILNDSVGFVLHSALLVPYFSWKISHGKHHKATGHMERDMTWAPKTRADYANKIGSFVHELHELTEETPIATALFLILQQLVGWPVYLITNATGHNNHERQPEGRGKGRKNGLTGGVNHFNPSSPLYESKDAKYILMSDIGLAITGTVLYFLTQKFGFYNMAVWYFIPYLWVNHWLVAITFLQHTDPSLPHYDNETWTFARGAASTIDREFGFIGRHLFHGIIETHVLHHYVSLIPFYHADEATEAIKPVMGKHYRSNVEGGCIGFMQSLWNSARMCHWVEPTEGATGIAKTVHFYRNRNGLGTPPAKIEKAQ